jgi:allantoinase
MPLPSHSRYDFSPIVRRPGWRWAEERELAVYIAINLEHFAFGGGLGAQLAPPPPTQPDVLNYSWRDYGNRVGAWRLLDLLADYSFPCLVLVNSEIYNYCPELPEAFQAAGHEIVAHGRGNHERQGGLSEVEERQLVREATDVLKQRGAAQPKGWLSPWISESHVTPDLLQVKRREPSCRSYPPCLDTGCETN